VVRAQDTFAGGQDQLVQGDRLIKAARVPVALARLLRDGQTCAEIVTATARFAVRIAE
jgi:hypothetical protein